MTETRVVPVKKVSQEVLNEIRDMRDNVVGELFSIDNVNDYFDNHHVISNWVYDSSVSDKENNQRLIALILYVGGDSGAIRLEEVKYVVRSKKRDNDGDYTFYKEYNEEMQLAEFTWNVNSALKFDTFELALERLLYGFEIVKVNV